MNLPVVAVVGRPNVGKSTLFNRIIGRREAIVEERPGVTRDRKISEAEWLGHRFAVMDTGGWMPSGTDLDDKVSAQSEKAMSGADAVLLVVDATTGITEEDARVGDLLRRLELPTLVVVNKVDSTSRDNDIWEFFNLGLGEPMGVSALHNRRTGDLMDRVLELLGMAPDVDGTSPTAGADGAAAFGVPEQDLEPAADDDIPGVAIVGRPNVGKSTLFNRLIGDDRSVVHDMPGTTRDAIDTIVETELGPIRFIDTAGMRRKARVDDSTEYYSNLRALRAIDGADVALLVIDAQVGVTSQDQRLAERVDAAGCPIVLLMNKWETLEQEDKDTVMFQLGQRLHFLGEAPVLRISALTGRGVHRLLPAVEAAIDAYERRVPTRKVNEVIQLAQSAQPAPHGARVLYATQGATHPPTFTLFTNRELPPSYLRYLERQLREAFDLGATPIKVRVRRRG